MILLENNEHIIPNEIQTNYVFAKKNKKKKAQNIKIYKKIQTKKANISKTTQIIHIIIAVGALAASKGAPKNF